MSGMLSEEVHVAGATASPSVLSAVGRLESTISLRIGEVKGLPSQSSGRPRDVYVCVTLDQEEIRRTSVIEKTSNPLFGESFTFQVPREFHQLSFYVHDADVIARDSRLGKVSFTREALTTSHEFTQEQWYPLSPITADSEVQGAVHIAINVTDGSSGNYISSAAQLNITVVECGGVSAGSLSGHFSDIYCTVSLFSMQGDSRSDVRRSQVRKRTTDPKFFETFQFKLSSIDDLSDMVCRVGVWHQTLLGDDVFLGQVHLSLAWVEPVKEYDAWYTLNPRHEVPVGGDGTLGSMRLIVVYHEDCIHQSSVYEPLRSLLVDSICEENFKNSAVSILHDVCRDRAGYSRAIVKIFLQLGKFEALVERLIHEEVDSTSDPNTIFRGNSVASKVIDEFMKVVGSVYLHHTLQTCIDEIFELRRSCEIDRSRLAEGENLDVNMTNLLFFVEKVLSAIVSSARSCPPIMVRVFSLLRASAMRKFPESADVVRYTAVSGFVFLRFFAPAILNPKLFALRPENPIPLVARCLLLISKTIQNLGNIGAKRASTIRKEDYMVPLLTELMDDSHVTAVKNYLDVVSTCCSDSHTRPVQVSVYREGFLVKRALARKKFGPKNFKRRYFTLTDSGLSYSKSRTDSIIHTIPVERMLAVERVDESAFNMKFMMQLVQPERVLYMQAKNSVDQNEWLSTLSRACNMNKSVGTRLVHSGAYINNCWTCCSHPSQDQPGCKPVSLAVKLLGQHEEADTERELHRVYRLMLENQDGLMELKDITTRNIRTSGVDLNSAKLPQRLKNICELLIFVKNLELSSKAIRRQSMQFGTRDTPFTCAVGEACVVR